MHIKWTSGGRGSAKAAAAYPVRELDSTGNKRDYIKVLRGDPRHFEELAGSLPYKNRWSHAIISWAAGDNPTEDQKGEVLERFVELATAGLESDQYYYMAVDHGDHLHIYFPRVELRTGKSFNPAPPGWMNVYDPLRDYFNEKYGWRSPNIEEHPENARLVQPRKLHIPASHARAKVAIINHIENLVTAGVLKNRVDIVKELVDGMDLRVVKERKSSISVKVPGVNKNIRLEGVAFYEQFDIKRVREKVARAREAENRRTAEDRRRRAAEIEERLAAIYAGRAENNGKRYRQKDAGGIDIEDRADRDLGRADRTPDRGVREEGVEAPLSGQRPYKERAKGVFDDTESFQGRNRRDPSQTRSPLPSPADGGRRGGGRSSVDGGRNRNNDRVSTSRRLKNGRNRKNADTGISRLQEELRAELERVDGRIQEIIARSDEAIRRAREELQRAHQEAGDATMGIEPAIEKLNERIEQRAGDYQRRRRGQVEQVAGHVEQQIGFFERAIGWVKERIGEFGEQLERAIERSKQSKKSQEPEEDYWEPAPRSPGMWL